MAERSAQRLLVFLPPHRAVAGSNTRSALSSSTLVHYVAFGAGPGAQSGQTPIALLPKANSVDLVFDTADVFVTAVETPKLSDAKLRQALPNLLEDRVLAEVQDSHYAFAPGAARGGGTTIAAAPKLPVAVIDRGLLTRALDVMADAGYRARAAYSAIYTIPAPAAGTMSVRVDGGRDVARSGKHEGFSFEFDGSAAPTALQLAVRQLGVKKIVAYGSDAGNLSHFAGELGATVEVSRQEVDLEATDSAVNLLQGAFAASGMFGGLFGGLPLPKLSRGALKLPLIYAGIGVAVFVVGMNAYWFKLQAEDKSIRSGMETAFRSAFPEATAVVDPVLQTRRNMGTLRARAGVASADDFSVLNAQAAQLLTMAPVGAVSGVEYRDGSLRVKFKPGMADNPTLQNTLRAQAIQQGLGLKFEPDGSARISPAGG
jgi:general secretion pathway protein L